MFNWSQKDESGGPEQGVGNQNSEKKGSGRWSQEDSRENCHTGPAHYAQSQMARQDPLWILVLCTPSYCSFLSRYFLFGCWENGCKLGSTMFGFRESVLICLLGICLLHFEFTAMIWSWSDVLKFSQMKFLFFCMSKMLILFVGIKWCKLFDDVTARTTLVFWGWTWTAACTWSWGCVGRTRIRIFIRLIKFLTQCFTSFVTIFMALTMPSSTSYGMNFERCSMLAFR